jgi:hypothetical protein
MSSVQWAIAGGIAGLFFVLLSLKLLAFKSVAAKLDGEMKEMKWINDSLALQQERIAQQQKLAAMMAKAYAAQALPDSTVSSPKILPSSSVMWNETKVTWFDGVTGEPHVEPDPEPKPKRAINLKGPR